MIINFANLGGGGGGGTTYTAGDNIQISGSTISVTGVTTDEEGEVISRAINDLNNRNGEKLQELSTLPTNPVDGEVYNYKGTLVKYVNGAGNWGEWRVSPYVTASTSKNAYGTLWYVSIPQSMDGKLLCTTVYSVSSSRLYFFLDLTNQVINVYSNSAGTGTTVATVAKGAGDVACENGNNKFLVRWEEGRMVWRKNASYSSCSLESSSLCGTSTGDAHYERFESVDNIISATTGACLTYYNANGDILDVTPYDYSQKTHKVNNSSYYYFAQSSSTAFPDAYYPTASGATGSLVVSAGNTAPVFRTIAQALGVDFWTGTQDEYDALAPDYSSTTLYIIVEED